MRVGPSLLKRDVLLALSLKLLKVSVPKIQAQRPELLTCGPKLGVTHICDSSNWEVKAGRLGFQSHPCLHSELEPSLD